MQDGTTSGQLGAGTAEEGADDGLVMAAGVVGLCDGTTADGDEADGTLWIGTRVEPGPVGTSVAVTGQTVVYCEIVEVMMYGVLLFTLAGQLVMVGAQLVIVISVVT